MKDGKMRVRRKKKGIGFFKVLLLIVVLIAVALIARQYLPWKHYADTEHGWKLILVNKDNYIPKDYKVKLLTLSNGKKVDARIYPKLQEMFDAARASGINLHVAEGYRSEEEQEDMMEEKIESFIEEGKSEGEAKKLARKWVALPGTSEHQLGLAVDINSRISTPSGPLYSWLANNSYKYGFILRYPPNKVSITGVKYEPWHFRYVGKSAAAEIHKQGICLEEYIEELD